MAGQLMLHIQLWPDRIIICHTKPTWIFPRFGLWAHKLFVKCVLASCSKIGPCPQISYLWNLKRWFRFLAGDEKNENTRFPELEISRVFAIRLLVAFCRFHEGFLNLKSCANFVSSVILWSNKVITLHMLPQFSCRGMCRVLACPCNFCLY